MKEGISYGDRIREMRKKHGLTQEQYAKKIGISLNSLKRYESNERQPPLHIIEKMAAEFGMSTSTFLWGSESEKPFWDYLTSGSESSWYGTPSEENKDTILDICLLIAKHCIESKMTSDLTFDLLVNFYRMYVTGKRKVVEYANDLAQIPEYEIRSERERQAIDKIKQERQVARFRNRYPGYSEYNKRKNEEKNLKAISLQTPNSTEDAEKKDSKEG